MNDDHRRNDSQHHHTVGEKTCELSKENIVMFYIHRCKAITAWVYICLII